MWFAHAGLLLVAVAAVLAGFFASPVAGILVAGAFAALFAVALAAQRLRGRRGRDAFRRAYALGFGWTQWF